jgi:hypothetical protein
MGFSLRRALSYIDGARGSSGSTSPSTYGGGAFLKRHRLYFVSPLEIQIGLRRDGLCRQVFPTASFT